MRLLRLFVLTLFAAGGLYSSSSAQNIGCADITKTPTELVRIDPFRGAPGDTVLMPYFVDSDSGAVGFRFLVKFDTTKLSLLRFPGIDSTFYEIVPAGRLRPILINSALIASQWEDRRDIISCFLSPALIDTVNGVFPDTVPGGLGALFFIRFVVNPTLQHGDTSRLFLYESDICFPDPINPLDSICVDGCEGAELSEVWFSEFLGGNVDQSSFPRLDFGVPIFTVDTLPQLPIISFSVAPSTIERGNTATLSWDLINTDSLEIIDTRTGSTEVPMTTVIAGSATVQPFDTTIYKLRAFGTGGTDSASVVLNVKVIGIPVDAPVITFSPATQTYSINQGQTVSFNITATDPNAGDQVTLTASVSPSSSNSTFNPSNPVTGINGVTMTYSFTPDFIQSGIFIVSFTATDGSNQAVPEQVTIVVNALQQDRLFSTSAPGQKPVGGLPGAKNIFFPINLVTAKTVFGVQFDMVYPSQFISIDSIMVTPRTPDYVVFENLRDVPGKVRVLAFGLNNEAIVTDTSTAILNVVMSIDTTATPWTAYTIQILDGRESTDPDPGVGSFSLLTDPGIIEADSLGDVNTDQTIDVADVVNIVSSIIGNSVFSVRQFATADIMTNDTINVFDLVADINLIFNVSPSPPAPPTGAPATVSIIYSDIQQGASDRLLITSENIPEEIAGVQLELGYDPLSLSLGVPHVTRDNEKFALSYRDDGNGSMKIVIYHLAPWRTDQLIQIGISDLVDIPIVARKDIHVGDKSQLRLTEALMSTSAAGSINVTGVDNILPFTFVLKQNYPNPFNPTTTIEFAVGAGGENGMPRVKLEVFNILGQRVSILKDELMAPGNYLIEWDATDSRGSRVATGVYLYRLRVDGEQQTKKMVLLK